MPEIPLLSNFYKNPILIDLFQEESKLKNLHNGLELSYIDINFLKKRNINKDQRLTLYNVLSEQYSNCGLEIPKNLKSIKNKGVFTITTGHQLCAFGGPQYFIHKIISVIKIAENLKVKYKEFDFIPMFWMATEDHDFQEISSLNIFNQNFSVNQKDSIGVGKLNPEIFSPIFEELKEIFKNDSRFNYLESIFTTEKFVLSYQLAASPLISAPTCVHVVPLQDGLKPTSFVPCSLKDRQILHSIDFLDLQI
jgi:hypothetical protein